MARRELIVAAVALMVAPPAGAKTYIGCGYRQHYEVTARPHECFLDWPQLVLADAIDLQRIRWHSWGGRSAPGRAVFRTKTYDPFEHVRVFAYRRRDCGQTALYTRVRVTGAHDGRRWSHVWKTMACGDLPTE